MLLPIVGVVRCSRYMFAYKLATSPRTKTPVSAHPKRTMEPITHPITEAKPIDWTSNQVLQLIREYGKRPALWDPDCEDNKNRFRKHQKWQELAAIFNCSKLEVERKMKILNSQYRRERLKAMRMRKAGEHHVVTWYGYSAFAFMNKNKHLAKKKFLMKNSGLQVIKIKQVRPCCLCFLRYKFYCRKNPIRRIL